jgi:HPt (histidine-containing phosphotransfer) domain-containing protein
MTTQESEAPIAVVDEDLRDLIPGFLSAKRADAARLNQALARHDDELVAHLAHQMKGEGGAYGFPVITELSAALEFAIGSEDRTAALKCAADLAQYLDRVRVIYAGR